MVREPKDLSPTPSALPYSTLLTFLQIDPYRDLWITLYDNVNVKVQVLIREIRIWREKLSERD